MEKHKVPVIKKRIICVPQEKWMVCRHKNLHWTSVETILHQEKNTSPLVHMSYYCCLSNEKRKKIDKFDYDMHKYMKPCDDYCVNAIDKLNRNECYHPLKED